MEALMTENLPVFFWFGEIPGLEPILLPAISNVEARVFTSGDFRKGQFFVGGQNFAGFLARDNLLAKAPGTVLIASVTISYTTTILNYQRKRRGIDERQNVVVSPCNY